MTVAVQCIKCFEVFSCTRYPDGHTYLDASPAMECWTSGEHIGMVVMAALYIPLLVLFPAFNWHLVSRQLREDTLHQAEAMEQWGFLHSM